MQYFKGMLKSGILLCLLILAACSSVDKKDPVEDTPAEGQVEGAEAPFVLIPNPYQPGSVPGPAKQEYSRIKQLMLAKKWQQAQGMLALMVETYPKLSGPYINLGITHHMLGEFEKAEQALTFAIETNPQNLDAYTRLGLLLRELGRFEEAEATYLKALKIWPHHLPSTTNLGILYDLYMGRFDDALVYYELSQQIAGGEDRQLKGWIIDLKRRIGSQ
ncbi:tetratricopeptide repeat protein [Agarilytica rhodophyticola]|uniref:tetratricopeptide repeat protein n=1 Tax=Agarilytica rhodophyticola TaxID=1737490 RepID=UPI00131A1E44|nr:tetratricopeptide repeat protein [Agarilytica rhodophyticola]